MNQKVTGKPPYMAAPPSHPFQTHLHPSNPFSFDPFTTSFDDQDLAFSFSRLNIMEQERFLNNNNNNNNNNNVAFMRAQNGGFSPEVELFGMPRGDFLVGPGPVMNNFNVGGGDFVEGLNFDLLGQMGYGYNQHGSSSPCLNDNGLFLETKMRKSYPNLTNLSQNDWDVQTRMNLSNIIKPKQQNEMFGLGDFSGKVVALAMDKNWSKILQMKIVGQSVEENEVVLSEVLDCVAELLKNQFGSYFVQKVFLHCNEEQRTRFIVAVTRVPYQLVSVCLCSHGAKSMQIILENLSTPDQISLVMSALSPGTVLLANDTYGHHVIQYCVESFPFEYNKHVLDEMAKNCLRIATDKSGCCVIQSCVEHSRGECKERLIKEIIANVLHIVEDPFGNYVVQHLLGLRVPQITYALTRRLKGHFSFLSCNKFASNVVEKFLVEAGEEHAATILKELLATPSDVVKLLVDPYGNFVIQSALSVSQEMQGQLFNNLIELIIVNAPFIRSNMYAKKGTITRRCQDQAGLELDPRLITELGS